MGTGSLIGGVIVAGFIGFIIFLLRRHQLREKYAVLWLVIGVAILILVLFPEVLFWATALAGIQVPTNLLFAATLVLLLGVCLHLAWEMSRAEDRVRRLSEEVALLRAKTERLEREADRGPNSNPPVDSAEDVL
jgi:Uncharacterized conserved protein